MNDTTMSDTVKAISFVVKASKLTSELLKDIMQEYLQKKISHGKTTYGKIAKQGKLENIEVTENNIADFLNTARKYDIDFALKRDSSTVPATYHIFFTASNTETFEKAFSEYATATSEKISKRNVVSREQITKNSEIISQKSSERDTEKHHSKSTIAGR